MRANSMATIAEIKKGLEISKEYYSLLKNKEVLDFFKCAIEHNLLSIPANCIGWEIGVFGKEHVVMFNGYKVFSVDVDNDTLIPLESHRDQCIMLLLISEFKKILE